MDLTRLLEIADRLATLYMRASEPEPHQRWRLDLDNLRMRCDECGDAPFEVKWGKIRVGYDLDGYYSQLTSDGTVRLLCRTCWNGSIGVDDPVYPFDAAKQAHG